MKKKEYKVGDVKKWQGIRNSDTGKIESGYLWIVTKVEGDTIESVGKNIEAKNRSEAIKLFTRVLNT